MGLLGLIPIPPQNNEPYGMNPKFITFCGLIAIVGGIQLVLIPKEGLNIPFFGEINFAKNWAQLILGTTLILCGMNCIYSQIRRVESVRRFRRYDTYLKLPREEQTVKYNTWYEKNPSGSPSWFGRL